jgi:hypothetical protein
VIIILVILKFNGENNLKHNILIYFCSLNHLWIEDISIHTQIQETRMCIQLPSVLELPICGD